MKNKIYEFTKKLNNKKDRSQLMQIFGLLLVILSPILWMISLSALDVLNKLGLGLLSLPTTMFFTALGGGILWASGKDTEISVNNAIKELKKSSNNKNNQLNKEKALSNNKIIEHKNNIENNTENDNSNIQPTIIQTIETHHNIATPKQFVKKKNNKFHN